MDCLSARIRKKSREALNLEHDDIDCHSKLSSMIREALQGNFRCTHCPTKILFVCIAYRRDIFFHLLRLALLEHLLHGKQLND